MNGDSQSGYATFGDLLRQHRLAAGLTQETLAERAGLSVRGISDLERGARSHPYRETVNMLASALSLAGNERAVFVQVARRGRRSAKRVEAPRLASLPVPLTSFVGRQADVSTVSGLLNDEHVRLMTLTGPGGVGKTRLAIAVAGDLNVAFSGATVFVDLAPFRHAAEVTTAVDAALGLGDSTTSPLSERARRTFSERLMLLVLDNFEHLLDAASVVSDLLRALPRLKVLVTSREPLRLRGEHEYLVAPLGLPEVSREPTLDVSQGDGAMRLFVERAQAVDAQFRLTGENATVVAAICRRLDGLPLAIELAAARTKLLPPAMLLARLDQRLPLLVGGPRDSPLRHRTLSDAIAWSYDFLPPEEQLLFTRLGVFAGGFTLDAAGSVCRGVDESRSQKESHGTLESIGSLVDKSLIWRSKGLAAERFAMLETIREFALGRLHEDRDVEDETRRAHAEYFLKMVEEARIGLVGPEQERWLAGLDAEDGNLRLALDWTLTYGAPEAALRFTRALWRHWSPRGRLADGRSWLERALARPGAEEAPAATRADAHNALGNLLGDSGEYAQARRHFEASLALRRAIGDADGVAGALNNLGLIAMWLGEYDEANRLHHESLEIRRKQGDRFGEALALSNLGDVALALSDFVRARELQIASLRLREAVGDATGSAYTHYNLGEIARLEGDLATARRELAEALRRFESLGDLLGIAYAEWSLSDLASREGNVAKAADLLERALELRIEIGDQRGFVECLETLGVIAIREGLDREGVTLLGAARGEREILLCPIPPSTNVELKRALDTAMVRLAMLGAESQSHVQSSSREDARGLANEVIERLLASESDTATAI